MLKTLAIFSALTGGLLLSSQAWSEDGKGLADSLTNLVSEGINVGLKGSDPAKVCQKSNMPFVVLHAKTGPLDVHAASVKAQAAAAIKRAGLKTSVANTPVAVCMISDMGELKADLSQINLGRLDVHTLAGAVDARLPSAGTPSGKFSNSSGSITIEVPSSMGVVLSSSKSNMGEINLDRKITKQGDDAHRANFSVTTTTGDVNFVPVGYSVAENTADESE